VIPQGARITIEAALNGFIVYEESDPLRPQTRVIERMVFTELVGGEKALATWLEFHFATKRQNIDGSNVFAPGTLGGPFVLLDQ
jgi:hypothetical protein